MSVQVTVSHNFETAHRLPHLPGKCQSLHGHSWWAHVTVTAPAVAAGMVVEFGPYKRQLRDWIDTRLDHGAILGDDDPLARILQAHDCKVHVMPVWPTVENVAAMIAVEAERILRTLTSAPGAEVTAVRVRETHVNEASWAR